MLKRKTEQLDLKSEKETAKKKSKERERGIWEKIPSPSLSNRLKASLNSEIWSSVSWSAIFVVLGKRREKERELERERERELICDFMSHENDLCDSSLCVCRISDRESNGGLYINIYSKVKKKRAPIPRPRPNYESIWFSLIFHVNKRVWSFFSDFAFFTFYHFYPLLFLPFMIFIYLCSLFLWTFSYFRFILLFFYFLAKMAAYSLFTLTSFWCLIYM